MSNDDTGRIDDIMDRDVSKAYRSIANERAPERLDKAILADAKRGAQTSRTPMLRWRRPLAWAATIALSFALLLEFTQMSPDLVPEPADSLSSNADAVAPAAARTDAPASAPGIEELVIKEEVAAETEAMREALAHEPAPAVQSEAAKRDRLRELETMAGPQASSDFVDQDASAAAASEELRIAATAMAERQEPLLKSRPMDRTEAFAALDPDSMPCGEAHDDQEEWQACIEKLWQDNRVDDALAEIALYNDEYPREALPTKRPAQTN